MIIVILLLLFTPALAHSATAWVDDNGAAAWGACQGSTPLSGASACAYATVMTNAAAGDTVYFRAGTYDVGLRGSNREVPNLNPTNSGTAGSPITFKGYNGETVTVTGSVDAGSRAAYFGCGTRNYITWDGFTTTYANLTTGESHMWGGWNSTGCVIKNSTFTGIDRTGQGTSNSSFLRFEFCDSCTATNNLFQNMGGGAGEVNTTAIWGFTSNALTITYNSCIGTHGCIYMKNGPNGGTFAYNFLQGGASPYEMSRGVYMSSQAVHTNDNIAVHHNLILTANTAIQTDNSGNTLDDMLIYNNTVYGGCGNRGILLVSGTLRALVYNNILSECPNVQSYVLDGTSDPTTGNYNLFNHSATITWRGGASGTTTYTSLAAWQAATMYDDNSTTSSPGFVNAGGTGRNDYKLVGGSAAIGAGQGGVDMGAFQGVSCLGQGCTSGVVFTSSIGGRGSFGGTVRLQ